jgi:hypothetical protein
MLDSVSLIIYHNADTDNPFYLTVDKSELDDIPSFLGRVFPLTTSQGNVVCVVEFSAATPPQSLVQMTGDKLLYCLRLIIAVLPCHAFFSTLSVVQSRICPFCLNLQNLRASPPPLSKGKTFGLVRKTHDGVIEVRSIGCY